MFVFCSMTDRSDFSDVCFLRLDRYRPKWDVVAADARSKVLQRDVQEFRARGLDATDFRRGRLLAAPSGGVINALVAPIYESGGLLGL